MIIELTEVSGCLKINVKLSQEQIEWLKNNQSIYTFVLNGEIGLAAHMSALFTQNGTVTLMTVTAHLPELSEKHWIGQILIQS